MREDTTPEKVAGTIGLIVIFVLIALI